MLVSFGCSISVPLVSDLYLYVYAHAVLFLDRIRWASQLMHRAYLYIRNHGASLPAQVVGFLDQIKWALSSCIELKYNGKAGLPAHVVGFIAQTKKLTN